jgi:hypothetical protein
MTDATLNRYLIYGTDADRLAFTPVPATGAPGANLLPIWCVSDVLGFPKYFWDTGTSAWVLWVEGGGSSRQLWQYKAKVSATSGYPGDGFMLWNNATQTSATALLLSHLTDDGLDIDLFLAFIASGDTIIVQDADTSANFQTWAVSGSPSNTNPGTSTSYWTIPTMLSTSGGTGTTGFAANTRLIVAVFAASSAGTVTTTGSPASGNLTKFSGAASITNGDLSGDVTTSGTLVTTIASNAVTTAKILNANVTLAKIANAAANDKLLGSGNTGSGAAYAEITLGSGLTMTGTTLSASGGAGTVTHTGTLTANALILGNGSADVTALGSLGTTTTVLHGNAAGAPTFGAVSLTADVSGTLPVANGGTGATTFTNHGVLIGQAGSAPVATTAGTAGQVLTSNGASADPTFQAAAAATIVQPQGRLTLTSNTPVMTADATAQASVYYTPYTGGYFPTYSGSAWSMLAFTQLTMSLDTSNQLSAKLYDLYVWSNSGTPAIGAGPAWTSSTARGTGAGTTELQQLNGIWTNKNSITLTNGAGGGTSGIAANTATYVGTIYCTANGQTGMAFKPAATNGGTNNILGVWNAYNRTTIQALNRDATASWTYSTFTWRAQNNSNSNRVSWVDGLQQSSVTGVRNQYLTPNTTAAFSAAGIALDSTSASPGVAGQADTANTVGGGNAVATEAFLPQIGFHFIQALELGGGAGTTTWYGGNGSRQLNGLTVSLEM